MGIKSTPVTIVLPDTKGKSFLFNIIDTPGDCVIPLKAAPHVGWIRDHMNPDFSLIKPFGPLDGAEQNKRKQGWLMRVSKSFVSGCGFV